MYVALSVFDDACGGEHFRSPRVFFFVSLYVLLHPTPPHPTSLVFVYFIFFQDLGGNPRMGFSRGVRGREAGDRGHSHFAAQTPGK